MKATPINNFKLGLFVLVSLVGLIFIFYRIGINRAYFGSSVTIHARFRDVQGLQNGNNVRYGGLQIGTVKDISILNDTTTEVTLAITNKAAGYIRKNSIASIVPDGFVGDKVVSIMAGSGISSSIQNGDLIRSKAPFDPASLLETVNGTGQEATMLISDMKDILKNIKNSTALWSLLSDQALADNIHQSSGDLRTTAQSASKTVEGLEKIVADLNKGKGFLGGLLKDSLYQIRIDSLYQSVNALMAEARSLTGELNNKVKGIDQEKSVAHSLLKDSLLAKQLAISIENVQTGTENFNQVMEALKKSIFLRGYFRKAEKAKAKK